MKKEFKLFEYLNGEKSKYIKKINEASGPFPTGDDENEDKSTDNETEDSDTSDETLDDALNTPQDSVDPTETPAEDQNVAISDTKLAMMANIILKAYMAQPGDDIPENLQTVTPENANEVIKFVEDKLTLDSPTQKLEDSLTAISNI